MENDKKRFNYECPDGSFIGYTADKECDPEKMKNLYEFLNPIEKQVLKEYQMEKSIKMIDRKTWSEFLETGLVWWINRILHTFGWAIVFEENDEGAITDVYPARVKFRGFDEKTEEKNFIKVTKYLSKTVKELEREVHEKQ